MNTILLSANSDVIHGQLTPTWIDLVTDLTQTDNPASWFGISRGGQNKLDVEGLSSNFSMRMKYPTGLVVTTNPQAVAIGIDNRNVPMLLKDPSGASNWTFT